MGKFGSAEIVLILVMLLAVFAAAIAWFISYQKSRKKEHDEILKRILDRTKPEEDIRDNS